jgi:hypothetical protein
MIDLEIEQSPICGGCPEPENRTLAEGGAESTSRCYYCGGWECSPDFLGICEYREEYRKEGKEIDYDYYDWDDPEA